jgi:hypothetical protein
MVGVGIVFAEPSMDVSVVGWLVVDPQKEELSRLEVGLEFERDRLEGDSVGRESFGFGCDCSRGRVHLASAFVHRVFMDE